MPKDKKTEEKIEKSETTSVMIVPMLEGTEVTQLIGTLKSGTETLKTEGGVARLPARNGKCGFCDQYIGVSWCNYMVPSRGYRLTITREL